MSTRTPGTLFALIQGPVVEALTVPSWRVVPVSTEQGLAMRRRGHIHVYDSSAQAYAISTRINLSKGCGKMTRFEILRCLCVHYPRIAVPFMNSLSAKEEFDNEAQLHKTAALFQAASGICNDCESTECDKTLDIWCSNVRVEIR